MVYLCPIPPTLVSPKERPVKWVGYVVIILCFFCSTARALDSPDIEPDEAEMKRGRAYIYEIKPERKTGKGYKLVYMVAAAINVYWDFKTDFDNDFLITNKYITNHRLVEHKANVAITENSYATKPHVLFKWQTKIDPESHRLDFLLLNPQECGQKFHHGIIQLKAAGNYTRVSQVAYFDFFGASLWVKYPWYGGMSYFLKYTARWEQQTLRRLIDRYKDTN